MREMKPHCHSLSFYSYGMFGLFIAVMFVLALLHLVFEFIAVDMERLPFN